MKQHTKKQTFNETMSHIQKSMSPIQRCFSRFVNASVINAISSACAATLFRPYAVIGASIGVIILLGISYLLASATGYGLAGSEGAIGLFIGWAAGMIIELVRTFTCNKK